MKEKKTLSQDDYYTLENGDIVFTKNYHLKRGYCCSSGCLHCPYGFNDDEETPIELQLDQKNKESKNQQDYYSNLDDDEIEKLLK